MRRLVMVSVAMLMVGVAVLAVAAMFPEATGAKWKPYTQVVDNATKRFDASKWGTTGRGAGYYGKNYRFARPSEGDTPAQFKMKIPKTALYTVYASWPKDRGFNKAARIAVETPAGVRWAKVDQRDGGGRWVKVGTFKMEEGDRYSVRISRDTTEDDPWNGRDPKRGDAPEGKNSRQAKRTLDDIGGYVVADAIKVKKAFEKDVTGQDVLREAKSWMGEEYTLGGCSKKDGVDCSCLTQRAYGTFGVYLPDDPGLQYGYGREVERSKLKAGDLVFFKEHGEAGGFTHVGMAIGNGTMIHASSYTGDVLVSHIDSVSGYAGARRVL